MSTLYKKILPPLPFILLTGVLWFHLQTMQEPLFFYREQQQIFLFDSTYIFSILKQIGGLATFISQFLIQFFRIPLIGSLVTALIGGISGWLFWPYERYIRHYILCPWPFSPSYSNIFT